MVELAKALRLSKVDVSYRKRKIVSLLSRRRIAKVSIQFLILPAVIGFTPTPHLCPSVPNIDEPHKLSLIEMLVILAPNGGRPCDGNKEPKVEVFIKTFSFSLLPSDDCLTWRSKHICGLLPFLPLCSSVLKIPNEKFRFKGFSITHEITKSEIVLTMQNRSQFKSISTNLEPNLKRKRIEKG